MPPADQHPPPGEVHDPQLRRLAAGTPTRIPGFFIRPEGDLLICPECHLQQVLHSASSVVGQLYECAGCGLRDRIPALDSEAGMVPAPRAAAAHTTHTDEREDPDAT